MKKKFYYDDEEIGLSPETSHPNFNEVIKEAFYFDCLEEFSPFGNDDGAEAMYALEEWHQETRGKNSIMRWLYEYVDNFGFKFSSKSAAKILDLNLLNQILAEDEFFLECMDEAIIAIAFGQYKIEGKINKELKELALIAFERRKILNQQILASGAVDYSKVLKIVDGLSTRPDEEGETTDLSLDYLNRLAIMKKDLEKFEEK